MNAVPLLEMTLLGVGLAMDAFAVSVTSGITLKRMHLRHAMRVAAFFGAFQAVMPLVGWLCGQLFRPFVAAIEHWVALILLVGVGVKMIHEGRKPDEEKADSNPLNVYVLFTLALATSIDAFAVGVTFTFLDIDILNAVAVIGLVTFVMSFLGTQIGKTFGHLFEDWLEELGGLILIGIGIKIFIQHQFFGG